jgi:hypothetical protein
MLIPYKTSKAVGIHGPWDPIGHPQSFATNLICASLLNMAGLTENVPKDEVQNERQKSLYRLSW